MTYTYLLTSVCCICRCIEDPRVAQGVCKTCTVVGQPITINYQSTYMIQYGVFSELFLNEESLGTPVDRGQLSARALKRVAFERLHGAELIVSAHLRNRNSAQSLVVSTEFY